MINCSIFYSRLHRTKTYPAVSGNALMIILIAVALFGALSFTVSSMLRSGENPSIVATQTRDLEASEILQQARILRQIVQDLRINGCADTDISFTINGTDGYEHTPAAPDRCQVFNAAGGGGSTALRSTEGYGWKFTAHYAVPGIGSANPELFAVMRIDDDGLCDALNLRLGYATPDLTGAGAIADALLNTTSLFQGSYSATGTIGETAMEGRYAACLDSATDGNPAAFIQVLIAR